MNNEITIVCEETGVLGDRRFRAVSCRVTRETEAAIEILDSAKNIKCWIPKSQIKTSKGFSRIPQWLWERKQLGWFPGCFSIVPSMIE